MAETQGQTIRGPKPDTLRDILEKSDQLAQLAVLFAEKTEGPNHFQLKFDILGELDQKAKEDIKDILLSVPKVLKLLKHEVPSTLKFQTF